MKIDIAGVYVDAITKSETVSVIKKLLTDGSKHYIVTPYSEQIVFAGKDEEYRRVLNDADLALPDGIGILWAANYLSIPASNFLVGLWQIVYTGASIIFRPKSVRRIIPQQVTGRHLVYDLVKLAQEKNYSLALVGGDENVAAQAAYELKKNFANLKINLALSGRPFDEQIVKEIANSNSDILLIAYSPPKQEKWIAHNLEKLNVKLAIGLGGTFDYIAKKRPPAPKLLHYMGVEWLWRLITQPWRAKRIWNAVPVFIHKVFKYKLNARSKN